MSRPSSIVARIRERVAEREAKLPDINAAIDMHQQALAEITVQLTALVAGIDDDKKLLRDAAPKATLSRKAKPQAGKVENVGNELAKEKV